MKMYRRRKAAFINRQIPIAAAITASCVALLIMCHAITKTRGLMTELLKKAYDKLISHREDGGDGTDIVYEEDAGDSHEI